jgi:hypothetical protein
MSNVAETNEEAVIHTSVVAMMKDARSTVGRERCLGEAIEVCGLREG